MYTLSCIIKTYCDNLAPILYDTLVGSVNEKLPQKRRVNSQAEVLTARLPGKRFQPQGYYGWYIFQISVKNMALQEAFLEVK